MRHLKYWLFALIFATGVGLVSYGLLFNHLISAGLFLIVLAAGFFIIGPINDYKKDHELENKFIRMRADEEARQSYSRIAAHGAKQIEAPSQMELSLEKSNPHPALHDQ